jgi:phosphoenolpyruvate carboxylase
LNEKVKLLLQNHLTETKNKDDEIQILKKMQEDLEKNLKKEKIFYETEIKKKEAINKNDKEFYEAEIGKVKKEITEEYSRLLEELKAEKNNIDEERLKLRATEKLLNN